MRNRCAYVESRLRALADGELEHNESCQVLRHVESCARCGGAYTELQGVLALVQSIEYEEPPDHFSADLQVRLARHRRERRQGQLEPRRLSLFRLRVSLPRWQWVGGVSGVMAACVALVLVLLTQQTSAADVARLAGQSWSRIHNYSCLFVSEGVYRGQERTFTQRQFFRRPGDFRFDTGQDYPLTTYVYRDRIIHLLPGGTWRGSGPLVIVRPRLEGSEVVPFPFGVAGQGGGNISIDQVIRQLNAHQDAELLGTEKLGDRACYRLRFSATPAGSRLADRYEIWVDRETYLPRRVSWFRDLDNHVITEAQALDVNSRVLPAGTFDFQMPDGAVVVHGDVDPHVFALPFLPARDRLADDEPVAATREEAWLRSDAVPFPVMVPGWLPEDARLVRVRRKSGWWVDMHWVREEGGRLRVVKMLQEAATGSPPPASGVEMLELGTRRAPRPAQIIRSEQPYKQIQLTWQQDGTRCTLIAAETDEAVVVRMARSFAAVTRPLPRVVATPAALEGAAAEPSFLPVESDLVSAPVPADARTGVANGSAITDQELPVMMPEMWDDDAGLTRTSPGAAR